MRILIPSPRFRNSAILILCIVCTIALVKSVTTSAQEESIKVKQATAAKSRVQSSYLSAEAMESALFPISQQSEFSPAATFTDPGGSGGTIPDAITTDVPSAIVDRPLVVSGLSGTVNSVSVTISGLTHSFPQDLDFLLVAPDGGVRNLEFWSDVAGQSQVTGFNITVADSGAAAIPPGTPVNGTTYKPAENQVSEANNYFVPFNNTINHAPLNGAATFATAFNGITGNGTWHLFLCDDENGDTGSFTSWTLTILTTGGNQPPAIANLNGDSSTFTEGGAAGLLDSGTAAAVTDSDSVNFNSGNLTASITLNEFSAEDVLGISTAGTITLSNGTNVGSTVAVGGTAIGTIAAAGTGTGGNDLIVTFNANATSANVTTLVRALTYFNSNSVNPNINTRTLAVTVNDGNGGTSAPVSMTVSVVATGDEGMTTFTNATGSGTIPDNGAAVVQTLNVTALAGNVTDVRITITGLTHTFANDLDFLLVAPNGTSNLEFWSDAAGNGQVTNVNVLLADFGATNLPNSAPVTNTTYRAADYSVTEANNYFGPTFAINHPQTNGIATFASAFKGILPNGLWTLYVKDGLGGETGGFTGWSLAIATDAGPPVNGPPIISNLNLDSPTFTEGGSALPVDVGGNASIADADSPNFDIGNLTVSITTNELTTEDVLGISTAGTITLSNGTNVGSVVSVGGTGIGTIAAGGTGTSGNDLIITFDADATPANVTTLVRALTYFNGNSVNPNINPRTLVVSVNDGDGATSLPASVTVNVAATGDEPMTTFTNSTGLSIPDSPAAAVSQTLVVSGLPSLIKDVKINITGLSHTFPQDLDFLLVSPDGATHNLEFWSDAGGQNPISNVNVSIADFGTLALPGGTAPVNNTTYFARDFAGGEANNYFGPTFTINHPATAGTATFATAFAGIVPNGTWTLFVRDGSSGEVGSITGWSLDIAAKGDSITSLVSSQDPSVFGQSVTFTATVAAVPPAVGTPTGTVNFLDGGNAITGCQNVNLVAGQAQCQTTSLSVGNHTITSTYGGDGGFFGSNGNMTGNPQVVNKADTSVGLTSSQNPAPLGANITFTATLSVTAPGAGNPTGTVQFLDGINPIAGCTAQTVTAGVATCMTTALTVGNHTITAAYSGDASFNTSNGSLTGNPQVITGPPTLTPTVGLTRVQGDPATNSQIATVSDDVSNPGAITVTAMTVPAGMTVTNIVNTNGTITADIAALCAAATGDNTIVLEATDGKGLDMTANLVINVTANPVPTLGNYANTNIVVGCKAFITPDAAPGDNQPLTSVTVSAPTFTGTIQVDPVTGLVTATNSGPVTAHTVTVTATDSCGAITTKMFTLTVVAPPTAPTEFDFDGDRKADISVYRTGATANDPSFWFILRSSDGMFQFVQFGAGSDVIVPGDYDGDGDTDPAVYRPATNTWFTSQDPGTNYGAFQWGTAGDIPVPGQYDADNKTDIAVFRPSNGNWYIARSTGGSEVRNWGQAGDKPIPADVDGDGKTDLVQYRESEFNFYIQKSGGGTSVQTWGQAGDKIVLADYDGDGMDDIAVFRPSTAFWHILQSSGGTRTEQWGLPGTDVPAPADYDNDGKADLTVYRTSEGAWYTFRSCPCVLNAAPFGIATDKPIPSAFTP